MCQPTFPTTALATHQQAPDRNPFSPGRLHNCWTMWKSDDFYLLILNISINVKNNRSVSHKFTYIPAIDWTCCSPLVIYKCFRKSALLKQADGKSKKCGIWWTFRLHWLGRVFSWTIYGVSSLDSPSNVSFRGEKTSTTVTDCYLARFRDRHGLFFLASMRVRQNEFGKVVVLWLDWNLWCI